MICWMQRRVAGLTRFAGRRPARLVALVAAGACAAPLLAGCAAKPAPAAPPPPLVGVVESRRMTVPVVSSPNGTTRALEQVTLRARVRGFLTERHFDEGAMVKKGQLLLVIDEEPYKIALETAQAKVSEVEAAVQKAEQSRNREVATAQLALDEAQLVLAQVEERRSQSLLRRNAGTREDLDKTEADRKKFEAQVEADRASRDQANADYKVAILSAKAQLAAAKASVRDAELNLSYCRMVAPIDGRIGLALVKVGNLVGPGQEGGSYTELATIQQLDPMGVDIRISSRYLDRATRLTAQNLKVGLSRPGLEGDQDHPYPGELFFIDNTVDETTGTFLGRARVPNPQGTLLPGEYVKLRVEVDRIEGAVVVPAQAVMETDAGPTVYLVDKDSKVAVQRVAAEQSYEGLRVLTKGLEPGAKVIVEGIQLVRPGMPVKFETATLVRPASDDAAKAAAAGPAEKSTAVAPAAARARAEERPDAPLTPGGDRSAVVTSQKVEQPRAADTATPAANPTPADAATPNATPTAPAAAPATPR